MRTRMGSDGQRLLLELPGGRRALDVKVAASGARFAGPDGAVFWSKGNDQAHLELPYRDQALPCARTETASPWVAAGMLARAAGNEPGWFLELQRDGAMKLTLDYGARKLELAAKHDSATRGALRVTSDDGRAEAVFRAARCVDTMSGQRFPMTVRLRVEDQRYEGCGRIYGDRG